MSSSLHFCIKCGNPLQRGDRFCGSCGWGPPSPSPPSSSRQNSSSKGLGFVAVLLLILISSIAGVWWVKPQLLQKIPVVSGILPSRMDLSDPKSYVPKENIKYTIHEIYPDSSEQVTLEVVVAKINPSILATAVEMIPQYEGKTDYFSSHYMVGSRGVYVVDDQRPGEPFLWLPNKLMKGGSWEYKTDQATIVWTVDDVGVTCDLGFTKIPDCLVIDYDLGWGGYRFLDYYAPGLGLVMRKEYHNGMVVRSLTGYKEMDSQQAQTVVKKNSRNMNKIKSMNE